jgi:hypothetical protein
MLVKRVPTSFFCRSYHRGEECFFFSGLRFSESESVGWIEVYGTSYYGEDAANKSAEWMESHNGEFADVNTAVDGRSNRNVCTLI